MSSGSRRRVSIYVVGPSSTGKTTLCNALAQKLGLPKIAYVTEIARQVMKEKGYSRETIASVQMQHDILNAYFHREEWLDKPQEPIRLFDRSALDPIVYSMLTSKNKEEADTRKSFLTASQNFQKVLQKYRSPESIVILLNPVAEWLVDDGIRSLENQDSCSILFKEFLTSLEVEFYKFGSQTKSIFERVILAMGLAKL